MKLAGHVWQDDPTEDALGRMLTRTDGTGTTTFVWDGMDCVMETDPYENVTRYNIVGYGTPVKYQPIYRRIPDASQHQPVYEDVHRLFR